MGTDSAYISSRLEWCRRELAAVKAELVKQIEKNEELRQRLANYLARRNV